MRRDKMGIVSLGHSGVGVTEVRCNHRQRCPGLQQVRGIGVAQYVEARRRVDPGAAASLAQRTMLVRLSPSDCIRSNTSAVPSFPAPCRFEQRHAIFGHDDMPWTTCFARAQANNAGVSPMEKPRFGHFLVAMRLPKRSATHDDFCKYMI